MPRIIDERRKSGDRCSISAWYDFDGYSEWPGEGLSEEVEMKVYMRAGDLFPQTCSNAPSCYWKIAPESRVAEYAFLVPGGKLPN